ncbi:ATP-binding protein [Streptomyces lavendofoliae]|uniref:ATP-binding protein n=1 Tax=Streptomyces lavendofoliae TaxID=67314 RepID=UPI003D8B289C
MVEEVRSLRRAMRTRLRHWGLHAHVDAALVCVSELVTNVIAHVGVGTPTTLAVSMNGTFLRIEVHDPDTRVLPTLLQAGSDAECGRGMALVNAAADRWGVQLRADRKVTWCEIATGLTAPDGHSGGPRVTRAESLLALFGAASSSRSAASLLTVAVAEEVAIDMISDLLHWLQAHGCDPDDAVDRAQTRFESETCA